MVYSECSLSVRQQLLKFSLQGYNILTIEYPEVENIAKLFSIGEVGFGLHVDFAHEAVPLPR